MTAIIAGAAIAAAVLVGGNSRRMPRTRVSNERRRRSLIRIPKRHDIDLGVLATDVATRLRAGLGVEQAWRVSLQRAGLPAREPVLDSRGTPRVLAELDSRGGFIAEFKSLVTGQPRISHLTRVTLPSLLVATRLTWQSGAPMADVLDECADGLTEAGEAQTARQIALQGPKSTAAMLAWLPLIGLMLGILMGVDPLGFLLGTALGRIFLILGAALEVGGILIVRRMVLSAQADGAIGRRS